MNTVKYALDEFVELAREASGLSEDDMRSYLEHVGETQEVAPTLEGAPYVWTTLILATCRRFNIDLTQDEVHRAVHHFAGHFATLLTRYVEELQ